MLTGCAKEPRICPLISARAVHCGAIVTIANENRLCLFIALSNPWQSSLQQATTVAMPLLKTCQTCFHAKIRCIKTQDSGVCDRCLRLSKTCVFNPARRNVVPEG